jgi:DNA invertase Pin-like site-specific DNA recombinase
MGLPLLEVLAAGDVLLVTRLDRPARSTRDRLNTLAAIAAKGASFRSLGDAWADTTTAHGRLMLTVLGGLAKFERELIRARTSDGRKRAIDGGVKMGLKARRFPEARGIEARPILRRRTELESVVLSDACPSVSRMVAAGNCCSASRVRRPTGRLAKYARYARRSIPPAKALSEGSETAAVTLGQSRAAHIGPCFSSAL